MAWATWAYQRQRGSPRVLQYCHHLGMGLGCHLVTIWVLKHAQGGGAGKKFARIFLYPPPLRGYPPKKKLARHVGIFFRQEEFFYCVLLEFACHLHFGTLYDIGT